ncbi:MAG: PepSY domain-containing protein [Alphaproteobacteria bacterium]|nr:PepSY domain-containing protein [Alphaproteobacteria bacterium]
MNVRATAIAAAILLGAPGWTLAQTTAPTATTTGSPADTPQISPSSRQAQNPGVNPNAAGTQMGGSAAANPPATTGYGGARSSASTAAPPTTAGDSDLKPGANSFTASQARRRIEREGYTKVSQLHKDQNSIWQAQAMKDGHPVRVGLDYRGHVAEQQ